MTTTTILRSFQYGIIYQKQKVLETTRKTMFEWNPERKKCHKMFKENKNQQLLSLTEGFYLALFIIKYDTCHTNNVSHTKRMCYVRMIPTANSIFEYTKKKLLHYDKRIRCIE